MKVAVAAGGTGGHVFPAIGFCEELQKWDKNIDVFFITSYRDTAYCSEWPSRCYYLKAIGLPRKLSIKLISFGFYLIKNIFSSLIMIYREQPDFIIGFGGYVSFTPLIAAIILRKPIVIHEQNTVPGLVNRKIAKYAKKIFVALQGDDKYWHPQVVAKISLVGAPIRNAAKVGTEIMDSIFKDKKFTVLIIGGSQGALIFNKWMPEVLADLKDLKSKIRFIHITGKHFFNEAKESYKRLGFENKCFKFYDRMSRLYNCVDFSLCRAGSGTLTELYMAKIPALVVPLPYATDNHQLANAKAFWDAQVFDVIEEKDCTAQIISAKMRYYFSNPVVLERKKEMFGDMGIENASAKMIQELVNDKILKK